MSAVPGVRLAVSAAGMARAAGFDNLNLDLMYGLPGQGVAAALTDLRGVLALEPAHLSWYQLTLEPNTWFHHHPPTGLPDDDGLVDIMEAGQAAIAAAGFDQYEVSAYASGDRRCRHNLNYWGFGDYLGLGAGAHGKLTLAADVIVRTTRPRQPAAYRAAIEQGVAAACRTVPAIERPLEFMLNALRLNDGVPAAWFADRTGLPQRAIATALATARQRGLLVDEPDRIGPTPRGQRFLNDLLALFEPPDAA